MNIGGKYVATSIVDSNYQLYVDSKGYFGIEIHHETGEVVSCFVLSPEWVAEHHPEYKLVMETIYNNYQ